MENLQDYFNQLIGRIKTYPNTISRPALFITITIFLLLLTGSFVAKINEKPKKVISAKEINSLEKPEENTKKNIKVLMIYVCGAVKNPGVYQLEEGLRITDAIEKAGGGLPGAQLETLNLAAKLTDGQKVYLPKAGENAVNQGLNGQINNEVEKININQADIKQLEELPGIGPVIAERIVKYREKNGLFSKIEELNNVEGIGPKKFESLKDSATVD